MKKGDTLIALADSYLSNPADWPKLQRLNRVSNPRRLVPGSSIRIPLAWMREETGQVEVVSVAGAVERGDGRAVAAGDRFSAGTELRTGANGFATLRIPDGSQIAVQPASSARVASASRYVNTDVFKSVVRLISGRIEAVVQNLRGPSRFEVQTDLAIAGVRGTQFRVASSGGAQPRAQAEVLDGAVDFASAAPGVAVSLAAGFGSVTDTNGRPRPPTALPAAPRIEAADALQESLVTRFRFPVVEGAVAYRAQVAQDRDFRRGIAEGRFETPEIKFGDLPDGDYFLRARAIDGAGLEGMDTVFAFRLKARPEPPLASAPAPNGKIRANRAAFAWASNPQAASYVLQVAEDDAFSRVVQEVSLVGDSIESKVLPFGEYFWRVRSVRGTGAAQDAGPWSAARKFALRPPPKNPEPPEETAGGLSFSWSAEPGQKFVFQVARDPLFSSMVEARELADPRVTIPRPAQGTYYLRVRAIDADGFVGPFTAPQRFTVINRVVDGTGANLFTTDGQPVRLQ